MRVPQSLVDFLKNRNQDVAPAANINIHHGVIPRQDQKEKMEE